MQGAVEAQGANTHVHDGTAAVTVGLVQCELTAVAYTIQEVGVAWFGIGHFVDDLLNVGDGAFEPCRGFRILHLQG